MPLWVSCTSFLILTNTLAKNTGGAIGWFQSFGMMPMWFHERVLYAPPMDRIKLLIWRATFSIFCGCLALLSTQITVQELKRFFLYFSVEFLFNIYMSDKKKGWHLFSCFIFIYFFFWPRTRQKNPYRDSSTIEYTECCLGSKNELTVSQCWCQLYLWSNLILSAYLVNRGYANFPKTAWMRTTCIRRFRIKIKHRKFSEIFTFLWSLPGRGCGSAFISPLTSWLIRLYRHPLTGNGLKAVIISENFQCLILNLRTCIIIGPIRYSILKV